MTKEESMDEFFACESNLVNECDRRFEDANLKVATYMFSRLKSCTASLQLLENLMENNNCDLSFISHGKITKTLSLMLKLTNVWSKHSECLQSNSKSPKFSRYNLITTHYGRAGRPSYEIDVEQVKLLRAYYFKWESIAKIFGIHRTTLWRRIKDCDFYAESNIAMSNGELDDLIKSIKNEHPLSRERIIIGILRAKGVSVERWKIRESIHRVDPFSAAIRWIQKHPRWIYSVPGPNSLCHNDGLQKLIHWKFVIHACIDGFSRMVTSLVCDSDNRTETALKAFVSGINVFGLPARVRGDCGTENVAIAEYMQ